MSEEIIEFEEKNGSWDKIKYYFSQTAPYITRAVDTLVYEIVRLIKSFFKYALKQIKSGD